MPLVELIIVLFVILAVITRFLTLYLLRKYRKLREDFDNARRAQSSEAANLRREIAELKKQIPSVLALPPAPTVPGGVSRSSGFSPGTVGAGGRETARAANASWRLLPRRNLLKRRLCRQRVPHLACRSQRCPPQRE